MAVVTQARARAALALAAEVQEAAKCVPMSAGDLLELIEPSAMTLEKRSPLDALTKIRALYSRLAEERVCRAVAELVPVPEQRAQLQAFRADLVSFLERLTDSSPEVRKQNSKALREEMKRILASALRSRFLRDLLDEGIEDGLREVLGDGAWLVPCLVDAQHPEQHCTDLELEGFETDAVSPLIAWFYCPTACAHCWGRLRQRMRRAIERIATRERLSLHVASESMLMKQAAEVLGVHPSMLSNYASGKVVPRWAEDDPARLRALLQRIGRGLVRSRVEEALRWKDEATKKQ